MNTRLAFMGGIGAGMGLMYLLDPGRGSRRRALVRDKIVSASHTIGDAAGRTARDMTNRSKGIVAEARALVARDEPSDRVVRDRVRSAMGRYVSHPRAIDVEVENGRVTLSGPILAREELDLLDCVSHVRGVAGVENRLEPHAEADIPALQGGRDRTGERFELMQENWSPAARTIVGAVGGALTLYGASRRDALGGVIGASGIALLARGAANTGAADLLSLAARSHSVDIRKTVTIEAPLEHVYAFWRRLDNFPRFMNNVEEVRDLGDGRWYWRVKGPAGVPVEWEARITRDEPDRVIAWESEPGSVVESAGQVRFETSATGATRVQVRMSYTPPAGAVGRGVASLFKSDPKRKVTADLDRMKSLVESPSRSGAITH
jgi:uncharacterized membrane protein